MHHHCFTTFRRRQDACPACRAPWPQTPNEKPLVAVGEGASRSDEDAGRSRRLRGSAASDDDEDEEMVYEESVTPRSQPTGRTQRARKGKAKLTQSMALDEDEEEQDEVVETGRKGPATRRSSRK